LNFAAAVRDAVSGKFFVSFVCFVVNSSVIPSEVEESLSRMSDERKTPEMRAQMTDLERLRHSASHVLATGILKIWAADCSAAQ